MRKIIQFSLLLFAANVVISGAFAQLPRLPKILAFGNLTYANPSNPDFKAIANNGIGYEIGAGLGLGKTIITASVGRMRYTIPNGIFADGVFITSQPDHLKVTPLKIGLRKYLIAGLFLHGDLGMAIQSYDKYNATAKSLLYEVGAGFKFGFVEVGAGYTGYKLAGTSMQANSVLLKAGLALKL